MNVENSYPLLWPHDWKRCAWPKASKFKTSFAVARDQIFRELKLMGVTNNIHNTNIILSTNIPLRKDGLPYAGQANPKDAGVAVYFKYKKNNMVLACDSYRKVEENLVAIGKTLEALRGIERWGASDMMERSFTGFAAISPPTATQKRDWWVVLNIPRGSHPDKIREAYRQLSFLHHPDRGGDPAKMAEINAANDEAKREHS